MSRKCSVMSCKSFDGECTFFSIPKTSLSSWTEIIKKINGCETKIKFVCEKHFLPQDIIKTYAGIQVRINIARIKILYNFQSFFHKLNY